jgi:uncharacterized membrane protein YdjX (TVP38/TMEM64 family)
LALKRRVPWRVIGLAALLPTSCLICLLSIRRGWLRPDLVLTLVRRSGALGMFAYLAAVVTLEILWIPRVWGLIAGGVLFGPLLGGVLSVVGDLLGGLVCYLVARGAGRQWVATLLKRRPRARRVIELLAERRGAVTLALLRICPLAHFTLVSYAAGLTGVRPAAFLVGTGVGLLPGAIIYPMLGDAALHPSSVVIFGSLGAVLLILGLTLWAGRRLLRT